MPMNETDMSLFDVMYNTRAMRKLDSREVPEDILVKLIDAANQAASGSNAQAARWIIVRDQDQKNKIASLNKAAVDVYVKMQLETVPELPHQDAEKRKRMMAAVQWQGDNLQNVPALIFPCYVMPEGVPDEMRPMGMSSVFPGVQNLLLAARAHGLGATLTSLVLSDRDAIRAVLGVPDNVEVYAMLPVGYPTGKFGPVTRLPADQTIEWDQWTS